MSCSVLSPAWSGIKQVQGRILYPEHWLNCAISVQYIQRVDNSAPVPSELSFPLALIACYMPLRDPSRRTWDALGYLRASVTMNLSVWLCSRLLTSLLYSRIANPARSRRVLDHNCHQPTTHQVPPHLFAELMRTIDKADLYRREGNRVTGLETTQKPTGEKLRSLARVYPPPTSSSVGDRANFSTRPLSLSALKKSTETDLWRFVRNYVSKAWLRVLKVFPRPCPPFFSPVYSYASVVRILLLSMTRTMQLLLRTHAKRAGSIVAGALKRRDLLQMPGEKTTQIESRKSESARTVGALRSDPSPCLRVGAPGVLQYIQRWYFSPRYSLELDTLKSPSIRVEAQVCARYAYCNILFHLCVIKFNAGGNGSCGPDDSSILPRPNHTQLDIVPLVSSYRQSNGPLL